MAASDADQENLLLYRAQHCFVVLNRFPYSSGHLMVLPYAHAADLSEVGEAVATEMMLLTRWAAKCIRQVYRPDGINLGMNLGEAAGAGVAGHIHMHVLPRWRGDANFITTIGETRVIPEELDVTWTRLRDAMASDPFTASA